MLQELKDNLYSLASAQDFEELKLYDVSICLLIEFFMAQASAIGEG